MKPAPDKLPLRNIPQQAFDWYDDYAHGRMNRRTFMSRITSLAVLGVSSASILDALMPDYARAEQVSFNDPDIKASYVNFNSPNGHGEGQGYFVQPTTSSGPWPAVLVIHENRGLNPYIKDVARRLAKQGDLAFAPDALFPLGGYPGNDDEGRVMQRSLESDKIHADFIAAATFIKAHPLCSGKLGAVGFCFGGYMVNYLAAAAADTLDAGVVFYGTPAAEELRAGIRGPLLIHLGEQDERVNATWPEYQQDLKNLQVDYQMHMYEKANHGFHNDSTARYDPDSAELAWQRTLAFFQRHLAG